MIPITNAAAAKIAGERTIWNWKSAAVHLRHLADFQGQSLIAGTLCMSSCGLLPRIETTNRQLPRKSNLCV
jgi:hypothetical protein